MAETLIIRKATENDMPEVWKMVQELAEYEKMTEPTIVSVEELTRDGFGPQPLYELFVAEAVRPTGNQLAGHLMCYLSYSATRGKLMFLQDLYVREQFRRHGLATKLFKEMAKSAKRQGCKRIDWHVLEWNPARKMYEAVGGENVTEKEGWLFYHIFEDGIEKLCSN